jgi:hypothetical protein
MTRTFLKTMPGALVLSAILTVTAAAQRETEMKPHTTRRSRGVIDTSSSPHVKLRSIPMRDTQLTAGFWKERFALCANHMVPTMEKAMSGPGSAKLGRIEWAAGLRLDNPGGVP